MYENDKKSLFFWENTWALTLLSTYIFRRISIGPVFVLISFYKVVLLYHLNVTDWLQPRNCDKELYKARYLIRNFYAKIKQYRVIAAWYDKLARHFFQCDSSSFLHGLVELMTRPTTVHIKLSKEVLLWYFGSYTNIFRALIPIC